MSEPGDYDAAMDDVLAQLGVTRPPVTTSELVHLKEDWITDFIRERQRTHGEEFEAAFRSGQLVIGFDPGDPDADPIVVVAMPTEIVTYQARFEPAQPVDGDSTAWRITIPFEVTGPEDSPAGPL